MVPRRSDFHGGVFAPLGWVPGVRDAEHDGCDQGREVVGPVAPVEPDKRAFVVPVHDVVVRRTVAVLLEQRQHQRGHARIAHEEAEEIDPGELRPRQGRHQSPHVIGLDLVPGNAAQTVHLGPERARCKGAAHPDGLLQRAHVGVAAEQLHRLPKPLHLADDVIGLVARGFDGFRAQAKIKRLVAHGVPKATRRAPHPDFQWIFAHVRARNTVH